MFLTAAALVVVGLLRLDAAVDPIVFVTVLFVCLFVQFACLFREFVIQITAKKNENHEALKKVKALEAKMNSSQGTKE